MPKTRVYFGFKKNASSFQNSEEDLFEGHEGNGDVADDVGSVETIETEDELDDDEVLSPTI